MDIWTETLERAHLPLLARWLDRADGALTPNDLPGDAAALPAWFERCAAEPGRLDCLALVYETPVGLAGLRQSGASEGAAALSLFLGERNYNPLRTATYLTLRMLDRAFLDLGLSQVHMEVHVRFGWYLEALERMGFQRGAEDGGRIPLRVEKERYLSRKYLF